MLLFHALPGGGRENPGNSRPPRGEGVKMLVIHALPGWGGVKMLLFHALPRGGRENVGISRPPNYLIIKSIFKFKNSY